MLGKRKLVLDTFCEVYDLLLPWMDLDFFDFSNHVPVSGAVYLIGRAQMNNNRQLVRELVEKDEIRVILSNPAEGSATLASHCDQVHECGDLVRSKRMLLIGGGDMGPEWPCLQFDSFLPKVFDYQENVQAAQRSSEIFAKENKPYKFLFLNGRLRGHRKYLLQRFAHNGLLDQAIWSCLDSRIGNPGPFNFFVDGKDLMLVEQPIKLVDHKYEVDRYRRLFDLPKDKNFIKHELFNQEWGEIYIEPAPYIDTYFSLVTETVFDYPYSFRTEKIWKPVAMGHPWIAVANQGYYKGMRNLGFKTFDHVIDESFDLIDNHQDRIHRIADIVEDLCQQNLDCFLKECRSVCQHNQQHLFEMRSRVRQEFPDRFFQFVKHYRFDE